MFLWGTVSNLKFSIYILFSPFLNLKFSLQLFVSTKTTPSWTLKATKMEAHEIEWWAGSHGGLELFDWRKRIHLVQSLMVSYYTTRFIIVMVMLTVSILVLPPVLPPLPPPPLVLLLVPVMIMSLLVLLALSPISQMPNVSTASAIWLWIKESSRLLGFSFIFNFGAAFLNICATRLNLVHISPPFLFSWPQLDHNLFLGFAASFFMNKTFWWFGFACFLY